MDVTIIVVNYNTKELTLNCIESVYKFTEGVSFELIVSDNGSVDGSVEAIRNQFPDVIVIENKANLGFGAANNRALKVAKGKYVLFLNSDAYLLNNAVKIFFDYWENSPEKDRIGALGCWLKDENGNYIHSGGPFPTYWGLLKFYLKLTIIHSAKSILKALHLERLYPKYKPQVETGDEVGHTFDIDYVTGADLFMLNDASAIYDGKYFMYYEESDMQFQLAKQGKIRRLVSGAEICHLEKKRKPGFPVAVFSDLHMQRSAYIYAKKNLKTKARLLKFLILLDWQIPAVKKMVRKYGVKL